MCVLHLKTNLCALTVLKAEGHSADTGAGKFPLVSMGGRAEGLACADPGARTPIGASGNLDYFVTIAEYIMGIYCLVTN